MRAAVICAIALVSAGGCRHAAVKSSACAPAAGSPVVAEERCPGAAPGVAAGPVCAPGAEVCLPPDAAPAERSMLSKCCFGKDKRPVIHVNVPPPNVVIQREREKECAERAPAAAKAPKPGNEVMLVPTTVYVPYQRMTPTGAAQMVPLNMVPGQPAAAPPPPVSAPAPCNTPPVSAPAPCNPPVSAPPPCTTSGASCPPGATSYLPPIPSANMAQTPANIDDLNRRCNNLETKIDTLIEALSKSRAGGPR